MPDLFPDVPTFLLCALIIAGAQFIYATVGFGAGMFAVALLALVLPDLAGAVATLLILTCVTEVWVLLHAWRAARGRLLLGLLPTMVVGLWLGTDLLLTADVDGLKRVLGVVVAAAGVWFLYQETVGQRGNAAPAADQPETAGDSTNGKVARGRIWTSLPAGFASGILAGMFGTGGPPVILFLKGFGLDKSAFRATLLWYFLLMSLLRGGAYWRADLLTSEVAHAALWLLPPTVVGIVVGMAVHRRLSERHFGGAVSVLLVILGVLLLVGVGK